MNAKGKTQTQTRPKYENKQTEKAERELMQAFRRYTQRTDLLGYKLPRRYELAFMLLDRDLDKNRWESCNVRAFAECKVRNYASTAFNTYMLSLAKYQTMRHLRETTHKQVFLIVGFTDAAMYVAIDENVMVKHAAGGRGDRGDLQDIEPCVYIPIEFFTKFADRVQTDSEKGPKFKYKASSG